MLDAGAALRKWCEKLASADAAVREESIHELELLGDTAALPALAQVFATDPDPALRAQAQAAGKTIYYAAIRRQFEQDEASEAERKQAAEILARARAQKNQKKRNRRGR